MKGVIISSGVIVTGIWLSVVVGGFVIWFGGLNTYINWRIMYLCLLSAPLLWVIAILRIERRILHGFKKVVNGETLTLVFRPIIFLIVVFVIHRIDTELSAVSAVWGQVIAYALSLVVGILLILRGETPRIMNSKVEYRWKDWLKTSVPLMSIRMLSMVADRAPILLLGPLIGSEEVGFLKIATQFSNLLTFPLIAVGSVASPMISDYYHRNKRKDLQKLIRLCTYGMFIPASVIALILGLSSHWLVPALYGPEFAHSVVPLLILTCAYLMHVMYGPVAHLLNMTGNEVMTMKATAYAASVSVLVSIALIPYWKIIGAAISAGLAKLVSNIVMEQGVKNEIGIRSSIWSLRGVPPV